MGLGFGELSGIMTAVFCGHVDSTRTRKLIQLSEFDSWVQSLLFLLLFLFHFISVKKEFFMVCVQLNWNRPVYLCLPATEQLRDCKRDEYLHKSKFSLTSCFLLFSAQKFH